MTLVHIWWDPPPQSLRGTGECGLSAGHTGAANNRVCEKGRTRRLVACGTGAAWDLFRRSRVLIFRKRWGTGSGWAFVCLPGILLGGSHIVCPSGHIP